jgi:hypothetical protein
MVGAAVAAALGIGEQQGREMDESVLAALADRHALLVLDNCEHLREGVTPFVERLLAGCPRLTVLATSRARLMVPFERVYEVPPLSLAGGGGSEAVALFVDRAAAVGWLLEPQQHDQVAELCRELDGIALAIELAAARLPGGPGGGRPCRLRRARRRVHRRADRAGGDVAETAALAERAVELARRTGDPLAESAALDALTGAHCWAGAAFDAAATARGRTDLLSSVPLSPASAYELVDALIMAADTSVAVGDLRGAQRWGRQLRDLPLLAETGQIATSRLLVADALAGNAGEVLAGSERFLDAWARSDRRRAAPPQRRRGGGGDGPRPARRRRRPGQVAGHRRRARRHTRAQRRLRPDLRRRRPAPSRPGGAGPGAARNRAGRAGEVGQLGVAALVRGDARGGRRARRASRRARPPRRRPDHRRRCTPGSAGDERLGGRWPGFKVPARPAGTAAG